MFFLDFIYKVGKNHQKVNNFQIDGVNVNKDKHDKDHEFKVPILNPDILKTIFSECSIESLGRLARVCKSFKVISYDNLVWKKIAMEFFPPLKKNCNGITLSFKEYVKKNNYWKLSQNEINCLALMEAKPCFQEHYFLPKELMRACDAMQKGTPELFKSGVLSEKGNHVPECNNAIEFLKKCTTDGSPFEKEIAVYCQKSWALTISTITNLDNFPNAINGTTMTCKELAKGLQALHTRIKKLLLA